MNERIVVDPVTGLEGHLRIEAETNERECDHRRLQFRYDGPRHSADPQRPRSA